MSEAKQLEVFYDNICPWCYLGTANTDRLRQERNIVAGPPVRKSGSRSLSRERVYSLRSP